MYQLLDNPGNGSYANIYRYVDYTDDEHRVKVIKRNSNSNYDYWSLLSEYDIMQVVNGSPYIIRMLGCVHRDKLPIQLPTINDSCDTFNIILESGDISLAQWITRYGTLYSKARFYHVKNIMLDVALGLNQLHYSGIIHRDLKVCNILLFRHCTDCVNRDVMQSCANCAYRAKIIDFGLSTFETSVNVPNVSIPYYRAPECYVPNRYDSKIDIWAYAVCMYVALIGTYNPILTIDQLPNQHMEVLSSNCIDDQAGDVILNLFGPIYANIYKNNSRMNLMSILYKAYSSEVPISELEQLVDLMTGCMRFDVNKRFSIEEVYNHPWFNDLERDIILRDSKRDEQAMRITQDNIRVGVMEFAQCLIRMVDIGRESRYSYREIIHGIQLFDRAYTYLNDNGLDTPSPTNIEVNNLSVQSRMKLMLVVCIYISFKYFATSVDGVRFKMLFKANTSDESIARLEYDVIVMCLGSQIYYPSVYELVSEDNDKLRSLLELIVNGNVVNNLKPSEIVSMN